MLESLMSSVVYLFSKQVEGNANYPEEVQEELFHVKLVEFCKSNERLTMIDFLCDVLADAEIDEELFVDNVKTYYQYPVGDFCYTASETDYDYVVRYFKKIINKMETEVC